MFVILHPFKAIQAMTVRSIRSRVNTDVNSPLLPTKSGWNPVRLILHGTQTITVFVKSISDNVEYKSNDRVVEEYDVGTTAEAESAV